MTEFTLRALSQPESETSDPLHELLRQGRGGRVGHLPSPIFSTAAITTIGNAMAFKSGRAFVAWLGLIA